MSSLTGWKTLPTCWTSLGQEDGNWDRAVARADEVKRPTALAISA